MGKSVAIIGTRGYPSYYGGFETAVRKIAPFLADNGWDVTVYGRAGASRDEDPTEDARVKTIITKGVETKSVSTLSYGFTASWHASHRKPDIALIMNVANGFFLPLFKFRGIPTIVNVDGIEWERAKWGKIAKAVFRVGAWFTAKFADHLIFDSQEIARRWAVGYQRDGTFIPYGGDVPAALPVETGLKHRGYVLLVARFVPENTVPEFIDAAENIAEHIPVVFVGSSGYGGELDEKVRRLAENNKDILWFGHISDDERLYSLWQHAAVYFHGHSVGGTNPTLVQALAAATPTVARDTLYNREVLPPETIFFHPDPESIIKAVLALALNTDEQESASRRNFQRSLDAYTWAGVCEAYERVLEKHLPG